MIREARIDEVRKIAEYMKTFEQATNFVNVNVDYTTKRYENLVSQGIAVLLVDEEDGDLRGGLGIIKAEDLHDGSMTAVETFWFVKPEHRGRGKDLFIEFENWSRRNGIKKMAMIHLVDSYPDRLENLYIHAGYRLVEKHYVKEL